VVNRLEMGTVLERRNISRRKEEVGDRYANSFVVRDPNAKLMCVLCYWAGLDGSSKTV
jgi:hypothetical protein